MSGSTPATQATLDRIFPARLEHSWTSDSSDSPAIPCVDPGEHPAHANTSHWTGLAKVDGEQRVVAVPAANQAQ